MVKNLTLYIIITAAFIMSYKHWLTLVLKLHDLFWVIYGTYLRGFKIKKATNNKIIALEQIFVLHSSKEV